MNYQAITEGRFLDRPNRFVAHVCIDGVTHTVHVKNTGRCRELLLPGALVRLERSDNPNRKTLYDLVAALKEGLGWVNIDSQAPNQVVKEWLEAQPFDFIKPEYTYGNSRVDFYMERGDQKYLLEVKGCTLEIDGIGYDTLSVSADAPVFLHKLHPLQQFFQKHPFPQCRRHLQPFLRRMKILCGRSNRDGIQLRLRLQEKAAFDSRMYHDWL